MDRQGLYEGAHVSATLNGLCEVSGNAGSLRQRIRNAQTVYRQYVADDSKWGKDPKLDALRKGAGDS
jgi:hypothetical protein